MPSIKNKPSQFCQLCSKRRANTREHLPPQAAFNAGEVHIKYIDSTSPSGSIQFRVLESNNGFWVPNLCDSCNHKVGFRYGDSYSVFATQVKGYELIEGNKGRAYVNLRKIYPLRILKQMFAMFLCAVPFEPAPRWHGIQEFVLKRDAPLPSSAPFVYLYMNISRTGRIVPCCGITDLSNHTTIVTSEISWPPIGVVFSFQKDERFALMEDITGWGQFNFKDKVNLIVHLPRLKVCSHYPLSFGSATEVDREQARRGLMYWFHVPEGSASPVDLGTILEQSS
jgi:hypothetical protein